MSAVIIDPHSNPLTRPFSRVFDREREAASRSEAAAWLILQNGRWKSGDEGASQFKVHLNSEPLPLAIEADMGSGWARVLVADANGNIQVGQTAKLHGVVTLVRIKE